MYHTLTRGSYLQYDKSPQLHHNVLDINVVLRVYPADGALTAEQLSSCGVSLHMCNLHNSAAGGAEAAQTPEVRGFSDATGTALTHHKPPNKTIYKRVCGSKSQHQSFCVRDTSSRSNHWFLFPQLNHDDCLRILFF